MQNKNTMTQQQGFTLIELMLSLALGMIVIGGMFALFTLNKETIRVQSALGLAQEEANFALEIIAEDIRLAGWPGPYAGGPSPLDSDPVAPLAQYDGIEDTGTQYDSITVSRLARPVDALNPLLTNGDLDCTGQPQVPGQQITHRYFVDSATKELRCESLGQLATVTIVDNVEAFQVLYGIDTQTGICGAGVNAECMRPTQYFTGDQLPGALMAVSGGFFNSGIDISHPDLYAIKAIQLAIIINTDEQDIVDPDIAMSQNYFLLNQTIGHGIDGADYSNGQSRRMAIKTIALRNVVRGP